MRPAAAVVVAASLLGSPAPAAPRDARLAGVETFALALGAPAHDAALPERLARFDLVVLDGHDTPTELIDGLKARGVLVLGYLSIGTIESGRPWSKAARPYRLDYWEDWGEWYADVGDPEFRSLVTGTIAPALLDRGFDGLFLDNLDMIAEHPARRDGMIDLVHELGALVDQRGGLLFAQNGEDVIDPMLDALDGWNREDVTATYDFDQRRYGLQPREARLGAQAALRRIADRGLLVTATDYTARNDRTGVARAIANACAAGAVPYVSDIELNRVPDVPASCG